MMKSTIEILHARNAQPRFIPLASRDWRVYSALLVAGYIVTPSGEFRRSIRKATAGRNPGVQ